MAAITSSAVTFIRSWENRDAAGNVIEKVSDLVITLSSQGATAGDIPASVLGFSKIYAVHAKCLVVSGPATKAVLVGVESDGSGIFPADVTNATDANRADPADVSGDLYVRIFGKA